MPTGNIYSTGKLFPLNQRSGDLFDTTFRELYPSLCLFADRYIKDQEVSADIVQDCFIVLYQKGLLEEKAEYLRAWLYNMVRNRCIDFLRRKSVKEKRIGEYRLIADQLTGEDIDEITRAETIRQLYAAISELPEPIREVVRMHWLEGKKFTEIAAITGVGYDNLRKRAAKGMKLLQEKIGPLIKYIIGATLFF